MGFAVLIRLHSLTDRTAVSGTVNGGSIPSGGTFFKHSPFTQVAARHQIIVSPYPHNSSALDLL